MACGYCERHVGRGARCPECGKVVGSTFTPRERLILAEAMIDPDALLPDPDVVEREGVADPGDVETEGWG